MSLAKRDEGSKVNSDINVTPMVDVMLVLLIIFMVVTPMLQKGAQVDMVQTQNPVAMQDADKEDAVLIAVTKAGDVYLGSNKLADPSTQLTGMVQDKLAKKTDKRVFLKADAHAKYGIVVDVVDDIRSAGVDQLGLLTEQKKTLNPPKVAAEPVNTVPTT
ncbi:MAG TPA: biopolymer transporter ExbD [Terriglobales bacterium]|nr:biopolymer transporter ExbD [Terriglobales bacterium]